MRTTIDNSGRLVIPKPVRDRLGLKGPVDLVIDGAALRIEPAAERDLATDTTWGRLVIPPSSATLTDDDVRALRDEQR